MRAQGLVGKVHSLSMATSNVTIWTCTLDQDLEKLQELLLDGVNVDSKNDLGETPLLLAASRGLERVTAVSA